MPKISPQHLAELNEFSEAHNPTWHHVREDLDRERSIRYELSDIRQELSHHLPPSRNPFALEELAEANENEIEHPQSLLSRVSQLRSDVAQLRDPEARKRLMLSLEDLEERSLEHYEPFLHRRVNDTASVLSRLAQEEQTTDESRAFRRTILTERTRSEIQDSLDEISCWRLPLERQIALTAVLQHEQHRFERYVAEPSLYPFEVQMRIAKQALLRERFAAFSDQEHALPRLGRTEDALRLPLDLRDARDRAQELLTHIRDEAIRQECTDEWNRLQSAIAYHEQDAQERLAFHIHRRKSQEELDPDAWAREVLSVLDEDSPEDIRRAFRALALQHHPDRATPEGRASATKKFQEISRAYHILSRDFAS